MPSPVLPSQFGDAVPASNADFCTRFTKWLNVPALLRDLFTWMLTPGGSPSDAFKAEVATYSTPTGALMYFASQNVGNGWLLCDHREISRSTYTALFAEIGTRFGAGNGTTTFNLPDGRGRSLIGAGTGDGLSLRDINAGYVGEEKHLQTITEMPVHTHGWVSPDSRVIKRGSDPATTCWHGTASEQTDPTGGGIAFNVTHACVIGWLHIKV